MAQAIIAPRFGLATHACLRNVISPFLRRLGIGRHGTAGGLMYVMIGSVVLWRANRLGVWMACEVLKLYIELSVELGPRALRQRTPS